MIYSDKKLSQHLIDNYFIKILKIRDSMEVTKMNEKDPYERVQEVSAKRSLEPFLTST